MAERKSPARRALARSLQLVAIALGVCLLVSLLRALSLSSRQPEVLELAVLELDEQALAERLARCVRIATISQESPSVEGGLAFEELHALLAELFPLCFEVLSPRVVGAGSLLFEWPGRDSEAEPLLLLAHLDVVPTEEPERWTHPPFSGVVEGGYVWGRGALDDKGGAIALLEAVEHLLARGVQPAQRVVIALGHDEEVGGEEGAGAMAQLLRERGEHFRFALDEGGFVTEGVVEISPAPVALVGVAEKGYLSLELSSVGTGGHSSAPPEHTAVGRVARAVTRIEAQPFPARLSGGTRGLFEHLAPELGLVERLALANLWWSESLLVEELLAKPSTAATLRTTCAATLIDGGVKANVLPAGARATVNLRILTGESVAATLARIVELVDDDEVHVEALQWAREPSSLSSTSSAGWRAVAESARAVFPDALVAPYLLTGATDTRHYEDLCSDVYRFLPMRVGPDDLARFHGTDERVSVAAYADAVRFYVALLERDLALD